MPAASASAAGKLIARLADLLDTNQYLQQMILAMSTGLGIEFDPSVDPETARALQTIYSNLPVPTSLTISMYNRLLDAKMTALQIESGLGNGTALRDESVSGIGRHSDQPGHRKRPGQQRTIPVPDRSASGPVERGRGPLQQHDSPAVTVSGHRIAGNPFDRHQQSEPDLDSGAGCFPGAWRAP